MKTPGKAILATLLCVAMAAPTLAGASGSTAGDAAAAAKGEAVITMRLDGEISVNPQGRVHDYEIRTKMTPGVQQLLDTAIPNWRFEPVLVDGKPVIARAPMRVVVAATQTGQNYSIRIDNVIFRPNTSAEFATEAKLSEADDGYRIEGVKMTPPSYPGDLMRKGVEGLVVLTVRINQDGSVGDVFAEQSSLLNVKGNPAQLEPALALLERSAVTTARRWRFRIHGSELATMNPIEHTVRVPVQYAIGTVRNLDFTGTWRYEYRGPHRMAPWLAAAGEDMIVGVSDLSSGEMLSGSPSLRLLNRDQALGASAP